MTAEWPQGYGLHILDEVDSTLNEAARLAPGLRGPVWIMARRQTAARGRRGRAWVSPATNLSATLIMRPTGSPSEAALRSFVAALALFDACRAVIGPQADLALKWPNDVLLNGGKLAGILLESAGSTAGLTHLAIGIGVNLAEAPDTADVETGAVAPVSLKGETGISVSPEDFLQHLAAAYTLYEQQFATYGFAPIRSAWLARAARIGTEITARSARDSWTGLFETVDAQGNLVLRTGSDRVVVPAADVFF